MAMTRTPIPNCPQPETPIRERAWTDEQLAAQAANPTPRGVSEYTAEQVERRATALRVAGLEEEAGMLEAGATAMRAYAATLRQPADSGRVEDERAAFEAWSRRGEGLNLCNVDDRYTSTQTRCAWNAWQARAALLRKAMMGRVFTYGE